MNDQRPTCTVCGDPMPEGEEMFKFHGYSGPCPKPPKARPVTTSKFTKGPWALFSDREALELTVMPAMRPGSIATLQFVSADESDPRNVEQNANADLIRSAPDLYRAAQRALECLSASYEQPQDATAIIADLKAAIAQADGNR